MRHISLTARYKAGQDCDGTLWRVYDEDAKKPWSEVQAFGIGVSIDDSGVYAKVVWIDYSVFDAGCTDIKALEAAARGELKEVTEICKVVSIDMKAEG